jgi:hypothetical protein
MSQSGAQAAAFFRDVTRHGTVWYVRDDEGSPAPVTSGGPRALPYWSTASRAARAARQWGGELRVESMPLDRWRHVTLPGLERDGLHIGINWSGPRLVGWDFTVPEVLNRLAHALGDGPYAKDND